MPELLQVFIVCQAPLLSFFCSFTVIEQCAVVYMALILPVACALPPLIDRPAEILEVREYLIGFSGDLEDSSPTAKQNPGAITAAMNRTDKRIQNSFFIVIPS